MIKFSLNSSQNFLTGELFLNMWVPLDQIKGNHIEHGFGTPHFNGQTGKKGSPKNNIERNDKNDKEYSEIELLGKKTIYIFQELDFLVSNKINHSIVHDIDHLIQLKKFLAI